MTQWCTRDCAVATTKILGHQILLVSAYLNIHLPVTPTWLSDIVTLASDRGIPILISMDSNAHSSLYGPDNNNRGGELEDFILLHGLQVHNTGSDPTYETRRGSCLIQTHIDVTLSRDLPFEITAWRVDRSYNASDHNTIRFETTRTDTQELTIRPWSKADWGIFRDVLRQADYRIPTGMSMKKLDKLTKHLYTLLQEALDRACPEISVTPTIKHSYWATEQHARWKSEVSALYSLAKRTNTDQAWANYKRADKEFKHRCKRDRNRAWREYKETLQSTKDMASLAKLAQRENRHDVNTLARPDGSTTEPGQDTIDLLTSTHFPAATGQ